MQRRSLIRALVSFPSVVAFVAACTGSAPQGVEPAASAQTVASAGPVTSAAPPSPGASAAVTGGQVAAPGVQAPPRASPPQDPRADGLAIAMGEWAVTPEAKAIRPGPVTLVITNRGKVTHGFELKAESGSGSGRSGSGRSGSSGSGSGRSGSGGSDSSGSGSSGSGSGRSGSGGSGETDNDSSGHRHGSGHGGGGRDGRLKIESALIRPGETVHLRVNLGPGTYEIECYVSNHDDLGMRNVLEVRADAPLTRPQPSAQTANAVAITGFAFQPASITVKVGQTVTWTNRDPAQHTVSEQGGAFTSPVLGAGASYRRSFDRPGTYSYFCAVHPPMKGTVVVTP